MLLLLEQIQGILTWTRIFVLDHLSALTIESVEHKTKSAAPRSFRSSCAISENQQPSESMETDNSEEDESSLSEHGTTESSL